MKPMNTPYPTLQPEGKHYWRYLGVMMQLLIREYECTHTNVSCLKTVYLFLKTVPHNRRVNYEK